MSDLRKRQYRSRIYEEYVLKMINHDSANYSQQDYQRWADAARIRLRDWLPKEPDLPVLDMGCGAGEFLYLLDQLGFTDLTGVDLSQEQISIAKKLCLRASIIQGDVRNILTQNHSHFGLITGFDILEHFDKEEVLPFLEAVVSALRPGGLLILQTPNAESPWFGAVAYGDFTHEWFFTPTSLMHILRLCGLKEFRVRASGPYVHGIMSLGRVIIWKMLHPIIKLWNIAETGNPGSGIYTRVFLLAAIKA